MDNHSRGTTAEMNVGKRDRTGPGTLRHQSTFYKDSTSPALTRLK